VQKEEVVYSHNIDYDIAGSENYTQAWKTLDLDADQKLYRLKFSYSVLPQLILHTKQSKQELEQDATNTRQRETRRRKKEKNSQDNS
jgi:hypothetical protein